LTRIPRIVTSRVYCRESPWLFGTNSRIASGGHDSCSGSGVSLGPQEQLIANGKATMLETFHGPAIFHPLIIAFRIWKVFSSQLPLFGFDRFKKVAKVTECAMTVYFPLDASLFGALISLAIGLVSRQVVIECFLRFSMASKP
jgi:hypothetical protein